MRKMSHKRRGEGRQGEGREIRSEMRGEKREWKRGEREERERKYTDVNLIGPEVALLASVAMKQ